jgi:hypothetical protein
VFVRIFVSSIMNLISIMHTFAGALCITNDCLIVMTIIKMVE